MKTLYYNGVVLSQEGKNATTFVVEKGYFTAVGNDYLMEKYAQENIQKINLKGRTVIPGFVDPHIHIWKVGSLKTHILDVRSLGSIAEIKAALEKFISKNPELPWVIARGFNEANLADQRMPDKNDLDLIKTDKPIFLQRTCAHIAIVNANALTMAQITASTQPPQGGEILKNTEGELLGILCETAMGLVTKHFPKNIFEDYATMIDSASKEMLAFGITSATDPAVSPDLLEAYQKLQKTKELKLRVNAVPIILPDGEKEPFPFPEHFFDDFLQVNTVKFFADGGLSGKTAALKRTYLNSSEKGILRLDEKQFNQLAQEAHNLGFKIATHAIGDAAIDVVLNCYLNLNKHNPDKIRHRIEHLGLPNKKQLKTIAEQEFWVVTQPIFITELGVNFRKYLDNEYIEQCYPYRSQLDLGVKTAFSSDAPVVKDFRPLAGIKAAVVRKDSEQVVFCDKQCITIQEALKAYTLNAAIANGNDKNIGSIKPGKWADFVILSENILETNPEKIDQIKILATFVGGINQLNHDF